MVRYSARTPQPAIQACHFQGLLPTPQGTASHTLRPHHMCLPHPFLATCTSKEPPRFPLVRHQNPCKGRTPTILFKVTFEAFKVVFLKILLVSTYHPIQSHTHIFGDYFSITPFLVPKSSFISNGNWRLKQLKFTLSQLLPGSEQGGGGVEWGVLPAYPAPGAPVFWACVCFPPLSSHHLLHLRSPPASPCEDMCSWRGVHQITQDFVSRPLLTSEKTVSPKKFHSQVRG